MELRKLQAKDAKGMLSWMHDDSINQVFLTDFKSFDEKKVLDFITASQTDGEQINRACVDDTDEYMGTVSLKHINLLDKNAEYAISLCKNAHGKGVAKYATDQILQMAFQELGLERVYLNVLTKNERANAFYKKYGFVFEGTFKNHVAVNGVLCDLTWYRMLKNEYKGH
jgi:Acetyltransferases, including N-acetylases of ribosomal proteins